MDRGAVAGRRHVDLARIGFGVGDELRNRRGRHRQVDLHHQRHAHDAGDRRDVADEIELEIVVERGVDGVVRPGHEQRVAVGRRVRDRLDRDIAAGAGTVVDDYGRSEPLRQPLRDDAGDDVLRAAARKAAEDAHRPRRIGLRPGDAGQGGERGDRDRLQELPAGRPHGVLARALPGGLFRLDAGRLDDRPPHEDTKARGGIHAVITGGESAVWRLRLRGLFWSPRQPSGCPHGTCDTDCNGLIQRTFLICPSGRLRFRRMPLLSSGASLVYMKI